MTPPIPADLWQQFCFLLAQYPNCQATMNAHEGQVCSMDVRIHLKAGHVPHLPAGMSPGMLSEQVNVNV